MGKGKPRAAKPQDFRPCRRCQTHIAIAHYEQSNHLCGVCWRKEWQEHRTYLHQNAFIIAELGAGFTDDLFSSELVIEADGGYFQTVRWHDIQTGRMMTGEHLDDFSSQEWNDIWTEAQWLQPQYFLDGAVMDDLEKYSICVRMNNGLQWMQWQADWRCVDGDRRFRQLWNRIHQSSPWRSRLALRIS
ncbi:MAG: hypothetical protein AAGD25_28010 [Cyanobacteria bacterium P01_F01_bin.150]